MAPLDPGNPSDVAAAAIFTAFRHPAYRQIQPPSHLLYRQFASARSAPSAIFIILGEDSLNIRMRGQQVLHDVQTLSTVEISRLAGQTLNLWAANARRKPFSPRLRAPQMFRQCLATQSLWRLRCFFAYSRQRSTAQHVISVFYAFDDIAFGLPGGQA
ncbi:hypothetical protein KCP71_06015 [Salmonella enterica subsp. enterica]|nr:hypothetical protein KCP71_06015 [Salmonella enterica subsp. enterica]